MSKSPDAFKTISEVADELKLPQHVLRFWETRFSQIKPMKRGGGRRYYRPDDVSLLRGIRHLLYGEGYTIKGVQRILKEQGARHVASIWQDDGDTSDPKPAPDQVVVAANVFEAPVQPVQTAVSPPAQPVGPAEVPASNGQSRAAMGETDQVVTNSGAGDAVTPPSLAQQAPLTPPSSQPQMVVSSQSTATPSGEVSASKSPVMPPFAVTHGVPAHLVDAITPETTLVETVDMHGGQRPNTQQENALPADILADDDNGKGIAKTISRGLLGKITGSDDGADKRQSQALLPKDDLERLQATLVDLLECKRLLDQIR